MSSYEFGQWMAFSRIEPFGYVANMHGDAQTAQVIANALVKKEGDEPYKVTDFLPKDPSEVYEQSVDEMINAATIMTMALGGEVKC